MQIELNYLDLPIIYLSMIRLKQVWIMQSMRLQWCIFIFLYLLS